MSSLGTVIGRGLLADRPTANIEIGSLYFVTDTSTMYRWSGSAWESVEGIDGTAHDPVTVSDSPSIDLTLTGQALTAAAIFAGSGVAGTVARSDHTHAATSPALDDLIDVAATGPADGDGLYYDAATSTWGNGQPPAGFSNPMTTEDDLIVGGTAGAPGRLGKGMDGQVLTVDPTTHHLSWADPPSGGSGLTDPTTTKGDLLARDASAVTRLGVGADGQVLTADSAAALGVSWQTPAAGGGGSALQQVSPGWSAGRYYSPASSIAYLSRSQGGLPLSNQAVATPIYVPRTNTISEIAVYETSPAAAGTLIRLGIYANGTDGLPGALVLDAGQVAADVAGARTIAISQVLTGGQWYWLVVSATAAITVANATIGQDMLGHTNPFSGVGAASVYRTVSPSGGPLPDPFTTGVSFTSQSPLVWVRAGTPS